MYGPVPPRRKKTGIVRSRNGCVTCKQQRRKCDETRPSCHQCIERGGQCGGYKQQLRFVELEPIKRSVGTRRKTNSPANVAARYPRPSGNATGDYTRLATAMSSDAIVRAEHVPQLNDNDTEEIPVLRPSESDASLWDSSIVSQSSPSDNGLRAAINVMLESSSSQWMYNLDYPLLDSQNIENSTQTFTFPTLGDNSFMPMSETNDSVSPIAPSFDKPQRYMIASPTVSHSHSPNLDIGQGQDEQTLNTSMVVQNADVLPSRTMSTPLSQSISKSSCHDHVGPSQSPQHPANHTATLTFASSVRKASNDDFENRQYYAHFMTHVAQLLPEPLQQVLMPLQTDHPTTCAVLALSAANLSHLQTPYSGKHTMQEKKHLGNAAFLYTQATGKLRAQFLDIEDALTIIMVLAYYEMQIGTVQGQWYHVAGLDTLILGHAIKLSSTSKGCLILRTWVILRARASLFRIPLLLDIEHKNGRQLQTLSAYSSTDSETIYSTISQGWSLGLRLLLTKCICLGYEDARTALQKIAIWFGSVRGTPDALLSHVASNPTSDSDIYDMLRELRQQLAELSTKMDKIVDQQSSARSAPATLLTEHGVEGIHFPSHSIAMTYAHFKLAQLLCDETSLTDLTHTPLKTMTDPINRRLRTILGIAEGLNPAACVYKNTFGLGISVVILMAAMRAPHPLAFQYLLDVLLPRLKAIGRPWEDSGYPLMLCQLVGTIMASEMRKGRKVFLAVLAGDESLEKDALFTVGWQNTLYTIHGRNPNGSLFNECIKASCYTTV